MRYLSMIIVSGLLCGLIYGSESNQIVFKKSNSMDFIILKADKKNMNTRVAAPIILNNGNGKQATFDVTYNGFTSQSQAAFQYAIDIWSMLLTSNVPINVEANWDSLGTNILGSASAATFIRVGDNTLPQNDTWFPIALAECFTSSGFNHPDSADIVANFNSNFSQWYFGIDGNCPAGRYDFVTVVLHELCHGLGFQGSMDISGNLGSWGFGSGYPFIYDHFTEDGSGQKLLNTTVYPSPSLALANILSSNNVFFNGIASNGANGFLPVRLFAPSSWNVGSSYSHLNESTFPAGNLNSLMTPSLGAAETIHNPGDITLGIFQDMGWTIDLTSGIEGITEYNLVNEYKLYQNYPNPFNPITNIKFDLLKRSKVKVQIYSLAGNLILTLLDEFRSVGSHQVKFKPSNLASGIYLYRIQADEYSKNRKMLFIK